MKATKILTEETSGLAVSSLPSRPTAESAIGGRGYTAKEMKAAFDRLPLFIIERYNALIDDIGAVGESSLAGAIPTGISQASSLSKVFEDIVSGRLATYMKVLDKSVVEHIAELTEKIKTLEEKI